jgi:hypothetical protein
MHWLARVARVGLAAAGLVLLTAGPAAADPAKPTDYRSVVQRIDPPSATSEVTVRVVGGDAFLDVHARSGHEVEVLAFSATASDGRGEPFLRIRADGVVEENLQSPYTYSIRDRYGRTLPPDNLDPTGPPQWQTVGGGGEFTWHDHRIHWMSPTRKPGLRPGDIVQSWTVPLLVDGQPVSVEGVLVLADPISPVPWFAVALVGGALTVLVGRGRSTLVAAAAVALAAAGALWAGWGEYRNVPSGAGANPFIVILPMAAIVAAVAALFFHRTKVAVVGTLAAVAAVGGWSILRIAVLLKPILPTSLPFGADRAATAVAMGCAAGAALLAVRSGALVPHFADLDDDDHEDDRPASARATGRVRTRPPTP